MAPTQSTDTTGPSNQLNTQIIVLICVCSFLVLFVIVLIIRQCIVSRGFCAECAVCGKAEETNNCFSCCIGLAESCNCSVPGSNTCCDNICGPRRHCDLVDCLTCGCGSPENCCDCGSSCQSPQFGCGCCDCPSIKCETPDCSEFYCCCCKISCKDSPTGQPPPQYPYPYPYPPPDPNQPYQYPNYPPPSDPNLPRGPGQPYPYGSNPYPAPVTSQSSQYPYSGYRSSRGSSHPMQSLGSSSIPPTQTHISRQPL